MRSSRVREAAVDGSFYPGDPEVLRVTVDQLLADAPPAILRVPTLLSLAGWKTAA